MDKNEDNCGFDLGYIQIIKNEEFLYKEFEEKEKSIVNKNKNFKIENNFELMNDSNDSNQCNQCLINQNMSQFYSFIEFNQKKAFICKYNDCQHIETHFRIFCISLLFLLLFNKLLHFCINSKNCLHSTICLSMEGMYRSVHS